MKKLILIVIASIFSGVLMAQSASVSKVNNEGNGVTVNQRGDIKEASAIGSKTEIRGGKGTFKNMKDMKERRHHRHHRRHHHHRQNNNQNKPHPAHNRLHR